MLTGRRWRSCRSQRVYQVEGARASKIVLQAEFGPSPARAPHMIGDTEVIRMWNSRILRSGRGETSIGRAGVQSHRLPVSVLEIEGIPVNIRRTVAAVLGALALMVGATPLVASAAPAAPGISGEVVAPAACARTYNAVMERQSPGGAYWYDVPTHHTVDCSTISIRALSSGCAYYRVRFIRTNDPRPWHLACEGQATNLATGVIIGTHYQVESTHANKTVRVRD